jgi:hypothetical protein
VKLRNVFYCCLLFLGGCITFTSIPPGEANLSGLIVTPQNTWNQAPREWTRLSRAEAKTWTKNGILLDRILIIPAVPDGEPLFRQTSESQALPRFNTDMLPNELAEFTESSIAKLFGEGGAVVETSGLRPQRFGADKGVMFDIEVRVSDGPDYKGVAGALTVGGKLYVIIFIGAEPYYYTESLDEATALIKSARVEIPQ